MNKAGAYTRGEQLEGTLAAKLGRLVGNALAYLASSSVTQNRLVSLTPGAFWTVDEFPVNIVDVVLTLKSRRKNWLN